MRPLPFHVVMIVLCVAIFVAQTAGYDWRWQGGLHQQSSPSYAVYQWFTHLFLHSSFPHIMLNMYGLGMFGSPLRNLLRDWQIALVYFTSGLAGAMLYALFVSDWSLLLGASGAVYGLLAAFAVLFPTARLSLMFVPFSFQARYFVGALLAYECWAQISGTSLFGNNIAHLAHVGGALGGGIMALIWRWWHLQKT